MPVNASAFDHGPGISELGRACGWRARSSHAIASMAFARSPAATIAKATQAPAQIAAMG
jgi:hypothetical protein